jgi:hypothetical protein
MEGSNDEYGDGSSGAVKENGRMLYAGKYAASITRRGDCGSGPAMTILCFCGMYNDRKKASLVQ